MYRQPILSPNVIASVYHSEILIKKGEQLNSLGFMFTSSILYSEEFPEISLTSQILLMFSINLHLSFSSEHLRIFVKCGMGRN